MIVPNIEIVSIAVILLIAAPILWYSQRNSSKGSFTFSQLIKNLNHSLKFQFLIGLILALIALIFKIASVEPIEYFAGILYTYLVVGLFFYLPTLGMLNLILLLGKWINK
ncbi:hypothetical protein CLV82_1269 [Zeaxanthinibacter enoshimensis]|uniref:Uncharacterized protein n=1 Tax=Zeaxanthinibacter enoshimensis TaxID=392009 RepID=A0A4R6TID1_9FLAO|nr:hypothetical protein CLV82_1269 [Zeaxanthinibacter enoshimensis]